MITTAKRYFSVLEQKQISVVFLYVSLEKKLKTDDLKRFSNIIKTKYNLKFRISAAEWNHDMDTTPNYEKYTKMDDYIDLYEFVPPQNFAFMDGMGSHPFYKKLFKKLIPYNLRKLKFI